VFGVGGLDVCFSDLFFFFFFFEGEWLDCKTESFGSTYQ